MERVHVPGRRPAEGRYQIDSAGRIHALVTRADGFDYRISDGRGQDVEEPAGRATRRVHRRPDRLPREQGHAASPRSRCTRTTSATGNDQDYVYALDIGSNTPVLLRRYTVGLGDVGSQAGVGNNVRMDFQTVAVYPDGKLAVSFLDSTTHYPSPTTGAEQARPAIAVELGTARG